MKTIAVIGRAQRDADDPMPRETLEIAEAVGQFIAKAGAAIITGGMTGVMEAASKGAKEAGGLVIGVLPGRDRRSANDYVDIAMPTGLGTARNIIDARAADAVIMVGGAVGTLNELTIAYAVGKPIVRPRRSPTMTRPSISQKRASWDAASRGLPSFNSSRIWVEE